ncbi:MAG: hypothetical protein KKD44_17645 [Proteobacteria bacterium]|nr:hypothetical protein [Pseudomonadota bacterium]
METLIIRTGRQGFVMADHILFLGPNRIGISKTIDKEDTQIHTGIEILAQAGALHVRYLTSLVKHAFLLKIQHVKAQKSCLEPGFYRAWGTLVSQSKQAYAYDLFAEKDGETRIEGRFLFALGDYDHHFRKDILESHYRNLFSCLKNDMPND